MSTSNFYTENAKAVYMYDTNFYYSQEDDVWTDEEIEGAERRPKDPDEILEEITGGADRRDGFEFYKDSKNWDDNRSYQAFYVAEKTSSVHYINLVGSVLVRFGYFDLANLDWEIKADGMEYDCAEDFADDMIQTYMEDNPGEFSDEEKENRRKEFLEAYEAMEKSLEDFCKKNCNKVLGCIGHANNGEAFYQVMA